MPFAQQETAVVALGGRVYVLGGLDTAGTTLRDVQIFDPASNQWTAGVPLPKPLHHINAVVVGERIFVTGALGAPSFTALGDTFVFDPTIPSWTPRASMPAGTERGASMVAAIGDRIVVAGGLRGGAVADTSIYDVGRDAWTPAPALPTARDHGAGVAIDGVFYAIGGRNSAFGGHTTRVDAFDPVASTWTARAPLPTSRGGFAAALLGGRVVVAGGEGNLAAANGMFDQVELYDPRADAWSVLPRMTTPRHGMGAIAIGRRLFVPGGGTVQGLAASDIVEALDLAD